MSSPATGGAFGTVIRTCAALVFPSGSDTAYGKVAVPTKPGSGSKVHSFVVALQVNDPTSVVLPSASARPVLATTVSTWLSGSVSGPLPLSSSTLTVTLAAEYAGSTMSSSCGRGAELFTVRVTVAVSHAGPPGAPPAFAMVGGLSSQTV